MAWEQVEPGPQPAPTPVYPLDEPVVPEKPQWEPVADLKGPRGETGKGGPPGPKGDTGYEPDLMDLTLLLENGLI